VTHVNIAFANPDSFGKLGIPNEDFYQVVKFLKKKGIIVYVSVGGAGVTGQLALNWKKYMHRSRRSEFIHNIKSFCVEYGFDGLDMDLEWDNVTSLYSGFVLELNDTLKAYNIGFTAALPGSFRYQELSDEALKVFDVINIMAYDYTGPWDPSHPGQHSSYEKAIEAIDFWKSQGVESRRLRLGVPFYGYDFMDLTNITSFSYSDIVKENKDYAYLDRVGEKYYNGINTINKKTELAKENNLKGIMIWELGQDTFYPDEDYSLLKAINSVLTADKDLEINNEFIIYPNPFNDKIVLDISDNQLSNGVELELFDIFGRKVYDEIIHSEKIDLSYLSNGVYFCKLYFNSYSQTGKIIKM